MGVRGESTPAPRRSWCRRRRSSLSLQARGTCLTYWSSLCFLLRRSRGARSVSLPKKGLEAVGLDISHAAAFDDEKWDNEIRTRMDAGLDLCGDDVGTPIIAFDDRRGVKQGYFGPVITRVPSTEDSVAMWDALQTMMNIDGFWELKRTRTERPEFGERP